MYQLNDAELDTVSGGTTAAPEPTPTGGTTYKCPSCGTAINAATRDTTVTCPNIMCRKTFKISKGKLVSAG